MTTPYKARENLPFKTTPASAKESKTTKEKQQNDANWPKHKLSIAKLESYAHSDKSFQRDLTTPSKRWHRQFRPDDGDPVLFGKPRHLADILASKECAMTH